MPRPFWLLIYPACFAAFCSSMKPPTEQGPEAGIESLVLKGEFSAPSSAYRRLFTPLEASDLPKLMAGPSTSVALQAAWESARVPQKRSPALEGRADWIYDPASLHRFVGFFTAKTGVSPPAWWEHTVSHVDLFPGQHHAFIDSKPPDQQTEGGLTTPKGVVAFLQRDKIRLVINTRTILLDSPPLLSGNILLFANDPERVYAARIDNGSGGFPYQLQAFDLSTGKPVW